MSSNSEGGSRSEGHASNTSYGVGTQSTRTEGNVVTNTTNSSSGDDRSASKSGSLSSTTLQNNWRFERGQTGHEHNQNEGMQECFPNHSHLPTSFQRPSNDSMSTNEQLTQLKFSRTGRNQPEGIRNSYSPSGILWTQGSKEENNHKHARSTEHRIKKRHKTGKDSEAVGNSSDTSDSGYEASSSSNNLSGTSSPSVSSSEASVRPSNENKMVKRKEKTNQQGFARESYCSSDLADFSSGVSSGSSLIISAGPLSEDTEDAATKTNTITDTPRYQANTVTHPTAAEIHISKTLGISASNRASSFRVPHYRQHNRVIKEITCKNRSTDRHNAMDHPIYKVPNTWSFVERQLKRKMNFEGILKKKTYEQHCKELNANYESAIKRIRHFDPQSIACSSISSENTNDATQKRASSNTPIYDIGVDVMANVLTYLKPVEAYSFLTMPLSKTFKCTFSDPQDLWKVLCLSEPFYAKADNTSDASDESICSYPVCKNVELKHLLGRYRLLYSSFIKCVRYLDRIMNDAKHGRTLAGTYDNGHTSESCFESNSSLRSFFSQAQTLKNGTESTWEGNSAPNQNTSPEMTDSSVDCSKKPQVKYGVSTLTNKLLGPANHGVVAGNVSLPWSCAIYSVVNWMVAFADVAGIQLMCLKVLPDVLNDEQQRTSAQHAGLTDIVLRAMVLFPDIVEIHTAAFHTLVLLARPLGGKEGMLFHSSMVKANGIFNIGSSTGKSGIAIMLDSMKRFVHDEDLQAMSCWSMVNIALIPSQKVVLVRLGGISAAANAMIHHPHSAEVQFRALFALINIVIPSENLAGNSLEAQEIREQIAGMNQGSETEMLDESMEQITNLVVVSMKNFCSSEAILNRACLVLHNLSLNESYHRALLLTPNCYQMIEWCIGNYRHDNVLQQSARGTLQRLQLTLSINESLRHEFTESLRIPQQLSMSTDHHENYAIAR
eukprot:CAMPEP_0176505926 /NCGR_PEP_ID=MMETSP0200_2-20121128/16764_1 /TAXON_ID=947934 /ORGANISM="Chaetoceros sp., Strain GSL56" /LENGTH=947 /DNA_ID=CAMNT_0017905531 /DNA_START=211 /DNA_END=3054 /DNA_ORIENTATION=+